MDRDPSQRKHTIVITGGSSPDPRALDHVGGHDEVVCADSGFDHALSLGLDVDLLVGDLDSISDHGRAEARRRGTSMLVADVDKDLTDTELALSASVARGATVITLLAGGGDRLDHLLGTISALASDTLSHLDHVAAWIAWDHLVVARPDRPVTLELPPGSLVSLLPLDGSARGVHTTGLRWPLHGETLRADRARGVSNEVVAPEMSVRLDDGVLAVIAPGLLDRLSPRSEGTNS